MDLGFYPNVWYSSSSEFACLYLTAIWVHTSGDIMKMQKNMNFFLPTSSHVGGLEFTTRPALASLHCRAPMGVRLELMGPELLVGLA